MIEQIPVTYKDQASMKHYFVIMFMTWAAMLFILLGSWALLLFGVNLGDFNIFVPVMFSIAAIALFSRTDWFDENVRQPLSDTLEFGSYVEVTIHLQLFTIICGIFGLGLGIAALTTFYPMGIKFMLQGLAAGNAEWHNFTKYTPMSVLSGCTFGVLLYSYLFADARSKRWLMRLILIGGFAIFFILGLMFGGDRYFFVITD